MSESQQTSAAADSEAQRPNRRQAAKVRTRLKVLEAARGLFAERGYDAATIRDIARAAGMSTGAVFANFQDKAELFETVYAEEMARTLTDLKAGAEREGATAERLIAALSAGYRRGMERLPLTQAMIARSWFQPTEANVRGRVHVQPLVGAIAAILEDGARRGELKPDADAALLARMIWELYVANFHFAAYDGWDMDALIAHAGRQIELVLAGQWVAD